MEPQTISEEWRSLPIFVSSPFLDMQAERDHLRNVVWPALTERLRERHHDLIPLDLRWGVETASLEEETAKEVHILKVLNVSISL